MNTKKILALVMAAVLLVAVSVAGTVAYLYDVTSEVENVFTGSNVDIELAETKENFKMVPGSDIAKDPTITVIKGSEACYVFVKVEYTPDKATFDQYMSYEIDSAWTELTSASTENAKVYYCTQAAVTADTTITVLKDNKVTVKNDVTNAMMDAIENGKLTMTFTAYAIQSENMDDAATAWENIGTTPYTTPAGAVEGTTK